MVISHTVTYKKKSIRCGAEVKIGARKIISRLVLRFSLVANRIIIVSEGIFFRSLASMKCVHNESSTRKWCMLGDSHLLEGCGRVCGERFNWFSADQFVDKEIDYLDQELSYS